MCAGLLGTVDSLSSSTLFWIAIAAALIAAELGITVMLVWLSARPMRSRDQSAVSTGGTETD
jgi:membrane protein implicated in regulation of membrane protease activity